MFFCVYLLLLFFSLSFATKKCRDLTKAEELQKFIHEQQVISVMSTGRIILQLMERKDRSVILESQMRKEIASYKRQLKKTMMRFLSNGAEPLVSDSVIRLGFFLVMEDCALMKVMRPSERVEIENNMAFYWMMTKLEQWDDRHITLVALLEQLNSIRGRIPK